MLAVSVKYILWANMGVQNTRLNLNTKMDAEEQLVAELERLGINYLSRQANRKAQRVRSPTILLRDLLRQQNSRIRNSIIAVLLAHTEYARYVPRLMAVLSLEEQQMFKLLYTAAVLLQRKYEHRLHGLSGSSWQWLPDYYSKELGLTYTTDSDGLQQLGEKQSAWTGVGVNWAGTYDQVAKHYIRRCERNTLWKA